MDDDDSKQWYVICKDTVGTEYFIYDTKKQVLEMEKIMEQSIGHGYVLRTHMTQHEQAMMESAGI